MLQGAPEEQTGLHVPRLNPERVKEAHSDGKPSYTLLCLRGDWAFLPFSTDTEVSFTADTDTPEAADVLSE